MPPTTRSRRADPDEDGKLVRAAIDTFDEEFAGLSLPGKLARISGMLSNVPKRGFNRNQNYNYTMESDLVGHVRPFLAAAGILIIPSVMSHERVSVGQTRSGQEMYLTIVDVEFTITDGSEHPIVMHTLGYGADPGDKGIYKAITGAVKYMLMKLFLIDTGDDPEGDERTDQISRPTAKIPSGNGGPEGGEDWGGDINIIGTSRPPAAKGGHVAKTTDTQYGRIVELVRQKGLGVGQFAGTISEALDRDAPTGREPMREFLHDLSSSEAGLLIATLEKDPGLDLDY